MTELVFSAFEKYGVAGVFVTLGFTIIVNLKNIFPLFDNYKKRRLNLLKEATSDENVNDQIKAHIQDEIDSEYFKLTHGVKVEKNKAICILNTHNKLGSSVPLRSYLNAVNYIFPQNGIMNIEVRKSDKISHYYNTFIAFLFFLTVPVIAALGSTANNAIDMLICYLFAFLMMGISIWMFASTRHYSSAVFIRKKLSLFCSESEENH